MSTSTKNARFNRKSYILTMLFALPALSIGNIAGRSDELIAGFAQFTSLVLLTLVTLWSIRRLRNAGKSGWWAFTIIPPATILLLGYNFFAPSSKDNSNTGLYIYGVRTKGFWRISLVTIISIFLCYLSALYLIFLTDGM